MLEPIEFKDFYLALNADVEDPGWTASQSCVGQQASFSSHLSSTYFVFVFEEYDDPQFLRKIQFDDLVQYFFFDPIYPHFLGREPEPD